ncbi:MAG: GNAT family N-acetyltransferase [Tannerella sp.]|jgi:GNAT superfamily N-acetyltransferase|nr:GNAT family N-acetyltransferase [Tannerella sp.]
MIFRKAALNDLRSMMDVVRQAQASLKALGIDQWQNGYPSEEVICRDIGNGDAFVLTDDDIVIAMATVIFNNEPTYDVIYEGEWLSRGEFVVVHRMAVADCSRKKGVASIIFHEVGMTAKSRNISSFKIDTHEGNIPMRNVLLKNGFKYCGKIFLKDGALRLAFEKIL